MFYVPFVPTARPASGILRLAARRRRTVLSHNPTLITALRNQSGLPHFARRFSSLGNLVSISRVTADARRGHYFAKARVATPAVHGAAYIVRCEEPDLDPLSKPARKERQIIIKAPVMNWSILLTRFGAEGEVATSPNPKRNLLRKSRTVAH